MTHDGAGASPSLQRLGWSALMGATALGALWRAQRRRERAVAVDPASLPSQLTVVLTTSPHRAMPSTSMLEFVLDSFRHVEGLVQCPLVIVCDGARERAPRAGAPGQPPPLIHRGRYVSAAGARAYEEYKRRVAAVAAAWPAPAQVLCLESQHGFGLAVRRALEHVTTKFVMVVQHDRTFEPCCRGHVRLPAVLDLMRRRESDVRCVTLLTTSLKRQSSVVTARWGKGCPGAELLRWFGRQELDASDADQGLLLRPLASFLDSTHVAVADHYRDFILGPAAAGGCPSVAGIPARDWRVRRGSFIEDCIGAAQFREFRARGPGSHARHGTWILLGPGGQVGTSPHAPDLADGEVLVRHVDGRKWREGKWGASSAVC